MATPKSVQENIKSHLVLPCASIELQQRPKKNCDMNNCFQLSKLWFGFMRDSETSNLAL